MTRGSGICPFLPCSPSPAAPALGCPPTAATDVQHSATRRRACLRWEGTTTDKRLPHGWRSMMVGREQSSSSAWRGWAAQPATAARSPLLRSSWRGVALLPAAAPSPCSALHAAVPLGIRGVRVDSKKKQIQSSVSAHPLPQPAAIGRCTGIGSCCSSPEASVR
ncbi:hypothetical protein IWZ00DRAFT_13051 [Phyllosticta capitalensis]